MMGKYDFETSPPNNPEMKYGIIGGYSSKIIFIKLPSESIYGYNNIYFSLANAISRYYGCNVICSSAPTNDASIEYDIQALRNYAQRKNIHFPEYIFLGIKEGANYGLAHLYNKFDFKEMILINMIITHELGNTIDLLNSIDRNKVKFIYGDKDTSYRYTPLLKRMYANVITIKGANDNFPECRDDCAILPRYI